MKNGRFIGGVVLFIPIFSMASGLPKATMQTLIKTLQDTHVEVRTAAALALAEMPEDAAMKPLEAALMASSDAAEQDAIEKALVAINDKDTAKRLSESLLNPQFTWGSGAKAKAVETVGKIAGKKYVKWFTELAAGDAEAAVRVAAIRALVEVGAPPKKEKSKE